MARSIHGTLTDALNVGHFSADSMVGEIIRNLTAAGYMIVDAPREAHGYPITDLRKELIAVNVRLNEKLHGAKDERDEHASKVTELRGTIARQASDLGEHNRQITALEARIRSIDERKVAALESEVANFTMMNSVQQRQITKLRGIIERDRTDLAAKGDLKRANETIAKQNERFDQTTRDLNEQVRVNRALLTQVTALKAKQHAYLPMEARINELRDALDGKRVRIRQLKESNSRQYSELSSLQASYALSERKVAGLTTSLTLANDEIARLQPLFHTRPGAVNHYDALGAARWPGTYNQVAGLHREIKGLEKEVADFAQMDTVQQKQITKLQDRLCFLERKNRDLRSKDVLSNEAATGRNIKPRPFPTVGQRLSELETKVDMVAKTIENNHANWRWS